MSGNEPSRARKVLTRTVAIAALLGVYGLATAGVTGVVMSATDSSAQAWRARGWRGGGWGWRGRGRYWGGRWYGYGVGPCWRVVRPGVWAWICG